MAITKLVISGADSKTISLAHKAEATSVVPDDNITATNVQSALEQLDDIKAQASNGTLFNPTFTGTVTSNANINLGNSDKLVFGDTGQLQIYSDGTDSFITESGSGSLNIKGNYLQLWSPDNELFFTCVADGSTSLFYNGNAHLYTSLHGVSVNGGLAVDTDTLYVDALNDRVGIGTASPATALDVTGTITCDSFNVSDGTETTSIPATADRISFSGATFNYIQSSTNLQLEPQGDLVLFGTGSEIMRLKSGNVGIGTTNPATALDVTGSLTISSATANVADLRRANNTGAGQVLLGNSDGYARLSGTNGSFDIFNSGNTAQRFGIANNGDISFYEDTGATAKLFWDASAESLGIGTTSPDGILHAHKANAGADTAIMLENSGQSGTSTASLVFTGNGGAGQEKARIKSAVYGDGYMAFHTNDDTEKMRIDSSGHVLVGTTSSAGDATNVKKVVGGVFTTLRDSVSVANNTATTVATLPSGEGNYMVSASLDNSNNPAHYNETAMVGVSQSSSAITVLKNASHLTLSMSGLNLQVTHNQGATQTIHFSILRIL